MLRTLQSRFALSHLLPVLLIIPLIGLATIYLVESRFFLDDLASELVVQGSLIAELVQSDQQLWHDLTAADQLIARLQPNMHARLMLLDSKRFAQIFNNLLGNASKYTPAAGRITVSASVMTAAGKPTLTIVVQDSGPGIAPEEQEKIFHNSPQF